MKNKLSIFVSICLFILVGCNSQKTDLHIDYEKYSLSNGLDIILHVDKSDPIVALAIQFHVGSNREEVGRTGFAHLFEHMMFQKSENVGEDQFFRIIQNAGGTLNGGTSNDATTYYEVVPKNALEKILWLESDRMGYMINTVTQKAFNIQQNVVQNEKRQGVDNQPYGHMGGVVAKNFYPKGHPYSWTVIGEMEDLLNATVEDVKGFHKKWYVPNNATLVLAGDFEVESAKALIEKYFGEIPKGNDIVDPEAQPVTLDKTKKLYHEDNFAKTSQFRMMWPTVEQYHPDSYPLAYLGQLISQGKKAAMYNVLVKEKKLTTSQYAYNGSQEIAGAFNVNVSANPGVSLKEIEESVFEAFARFEEEEFSEEDVERIKAGQETGFYNGISSILGKSFQLARYNEYAGTPDYYKTDIEKMKAVTKEDILRVYQQYIEDKPYLAVSFVPKGQVDMVAEGSVSAGVVEEDILNATEVLIDDQAVDEEIAKTPSSFDRSIMPVDGTDPSLNIPQVWSTELDNGIKVLGIEQTELPLVQFNILINGGHFLDPMDKAGTASLMAQLMNEGTKNKTPQELEEEIEKLGAGIYIRASGNSISISANCLARNYNKTLELVREILLEPRWDEEEFGLAKTRVLNGLIRQKASPNSLARNAFNELVYGQDHILSIGTSGNEETVAAITMDDLKAYYNANIVPGLSSFLVAGDIDEETVVASLDILVDAWAEKEVSFPTYTLPNPLDKSQIYFVDVPGAKQSVINIGCLGIPRTHSDYFPVTVMCYKLGGSFNSFVNMVLREEKGFTYGARAGFSGGIEAGTFTASSSVRSSATFESVKIFKELMEMYRDGISEEDMAFTKNSLVKSNARRFETIGSLLGMLRNIATYDLPFDYIKGEEEIVNGMTFDSHKDLAQKYINPDMMFYVIAGDAATQMEALEDIGFGKPILVK